MHQEENLDFEWRPRRRLRLVGTRRYFSEDILFGFVYQQHGTVAVEFVNWYANGSGHW